VQMEEDFVKVPVLCGNVMLCYVFVYAYMYVYVCIYVPNL
jgi:hypothetical protein